MMSMFGSIPPYTLICCSINALLRAILYIISSLIVRQFDTHEISCYNHLIYVADVLLTALLVTDPKLRKQLPINHFLLHECESSCIPEGKFSRVDHCAHCFDLTMTTTMTGQQRQRRTVQWSPCIGWLEARTRERARRHSGIWWAHGKAHLLRRTCRQPRAIWNS